ncbi:MAG TPA: 2-phosphosulfolactate phosphatase [Bacteroidales bacterium]|nr:2-phosphosulfolactate phosphatase [Bacteroidales bacterium]
MNKRNLETCFSPLLFEPDLHTDSIVVIFDIFRATSSMCTAFEHGAHSIIPVAEVEEARAYKERGFLIAAERDGIILDFADFGNSPYNFTREKVEGKTIIYSTTNGTGIIKLASSARYIVIGSFLNITSLAEWLFTQDNSVLLFCAGWKNRFNLEDTVCAGAVAEKLLNSTLYSTICDSTLAALDLWSMAKDDLRGYIEKAAHRTRLKKNGLDDCIDFCLTADYTRKIPVIKNNILVGDIL